MPSAQLVIELTADQSDAVKGFDDVTGSARAMAREVAEAGSAAESASRKVGLSADAADELGGKAGKATGALGALSSGFELVGAEKYAGALQGAALATDFMSGVGDSLNLVMESTIVKNIRARAAAVAHGVATGALAAKTAVMTGAQAALNLVMSANPVLVVVLGIAALVAILVLAYKRSSTFREILQTVGRVGRDALELITLPMRTVFELVGKVASALKDRFPGAFKVLETVGEKVKTVLLAPFEAVKAIIDKILDLIGKIKLPDLKGGGVPFVPGIRAAASSDPFAPQLVGGTQPTVINQITISGLLDSTEAAEKIERLLNSRARRLGLA